jgi:hypothetical protein
MGCGSSNTEKVKPSITPVSKTENSHLEGPKVTLEELRNTMRIIQDGIP